MPIASLEMVPEMLVNALSTRLAQMTMVTRMLIGAYKRCLRVHTSSNGAKGRRG
jgi:hypothetical protein